MVHSRQPYLRSENGKREIADAMHEKYNKQLQCPACDFECGSRGAFNKDSGGTPDEVGRLYRRFKCRARPRCPKTLGVTEFLDMCQKLLSTTSIDQPANLTSSGTFSSVYLIYYYYQETHTTYENLLVIILILMYLLYTNIS